MMRSARNCASLLSQPPRFNGEKYGNSWLAVVNKALKNGKNLPLGCEGDFLHFIA